MVVRNDCSEEGKENLVTLNYRIYLSLKVDFKMGRMECNGA